jgi:hypothetical protein
MSGAKNKTFIAKRLTDFQLFNSFIISRSSSISALLLRLMYLPLYREKRHP